MEIGRGRALYVLVESQVEKWIQKSQFERGLGRGRPLLGAILVCCLFYILWVKSGKIKPLVSHTHFLLPVLPLTLLDVLIFLPLLAHIEWKVTWGIVSSSYVCLCPHTLKLFETPKVTDGFYLRSRFVSAKEPARNLWLQLSSCASLNQCRVQSCENLWDPGQLIIIILLLLSRHPVTHYSLIHASSSIWSCAIFTCFSAARGLCTKQRSAECQTKSRSLTICVCLGEEAVYMFTNHVNTFSDLDQTPDTYNMHGHISHNIINRWSDWQWLSWFNGTCQWVGWIRIQGNILPSQKMCRLQSTSETADHCWVFPVCRMLYLLKMV